MPRTSPNPKRSMYFVIISLFCWCGSLGALFFSALGLSAFLAPDNWFADNMSFFLRQFLAAGVLGCLAGALGLMLRHRLAFLYRVTWVLALITLIPLAGLAVARAFENTAKTETPRANDLIVKIVTINIEGLFLGDKTLAAFLEKESPDILVIQEAMWWLQKRRWERLALPVGGAGENGFPEHLIVGKAGSLVVYSRFPVIRQTSRMIRGNLHEGARVVHDADRELLQLNLGTQTSPFTLLAVHPDSPRNQVRWRNKRIYFDEVDKAIQSVRQTGGDPLIVIGDWNSSPWSARFQQTLSQNGLRTAYPDGWPQTTRFFFDYRLHWILGAPVDQFAVSSGISVLSVSTGPDIGSDHLPLIVELGLPAPRGN